MYAVRIHEHGSVDVMRYEEVPTPEPGAGEVRVKLAAVGINFIDTYQRAGLYKVALPFILGQEGAGVVDTVGEGVTDFKAGDPVVYTSVPYAYAQYTIVPAARLLHLPDKLDFHQAAAVILQGLTAHYLVNSTFPLKAEHTALIHAAGGGTGQILVQLAKRTGARIIGTASSDEKLQLARQAGADHVINYTTQDFEAEVKTLTEGKGVDVVYDSVGKTTFDKSLNSLRPRGYLVLFGQSSGPVPPLDPQVLNARGSLFLTRPTLGNYIATRDELEWRAKEVLSLAASGELRVQIDQTWPLSEAAAAHQYLEGRQSKGKLLLIPQG
jgi:NADPH:quinone reductase